MVEKDQVLFLFGFVVMVHKQIIRFLPLRSRLPPTPLQTPAPPATTSPTPLGAFTKRSPQHQFQLKSQMAKLSHPPTRHCSHKHAFHFDPDKHTFPPDLNKPLIFIGKLCDNTRTAVFNATTVKLVDQKTQKTIMQGNRDPASTLYMTDMEKTQQLITAPYTPDNLVANHAYEPKSKQDLVLFYHAA